MKYYILSGPEKDGLRWMGDAENPKTAAIRGLASYEGRGITVGKQLLVTQHGFDHNRCEDEDVAFYVDDLLREMESA